jgi:Zn-dependent peptidase ImmA (M78 family)
MPKVNPDILRWARETAGFTAEDAVKVLNLNDARGVSAVERLAALESGVNEPTRPLLLRMAKQYRRPLLAFYMSAPPRKGDRGQDFRTLPDGCSASEAALLDALIRDIQVRQSMVRAIIEDEEEVEPLPFIGSAKVSDGVPAILASIREVVQFDLDDFRGRSTPSEAFALLRDKVEAAGIFVMLIGNLGSHHTAIDLDVFRGFALADEIAPFVIINDQDAHSAWSFTLVHELVHLWLGQTGVSGLRAEKAIERFCNDVASEFLLPSQELKGLHFDETDITNAQRLISDFAAERRLSSSMVVYKLFRTNLISQDTWEHLSRVYRRLWLDKRSEERMKSKGKESGGPNYFIVRRHRVGRTLINFIGRMMASGAVTTTKAGKILGVKSSNVQTLIDAGRSI